MFRSNVPTVIAITALAVAVLGATPLGHAASRMIVPKSSVGAPQLKKNAVTSLKVKDGSLRASDFKAGQLPAGPQGLAGPQGPKGAPGTPGLSGFQVVKSDTKMADPGEEVSAGAGCPLGKTAIAGGLNSGQPLAILGSSPGGQWWYVNAKNVGSAATAMYAYAVCAVVS